MKIKIAITDANIFIDLYDLELINQFFSLDIEMHTTTTVLHELYSEQQQVLLAYKSVNKLTIHNIEEQDFIDIYKENYPKSLSETDKTVLHVANKISACVLTSDKTLRNCAKNKEIECHGMLWVFDKLTESNIMTKNDVVTKLKQLTEINFTFRNNEKLKIEIEKRLKL